MGVRRSLGVALVASVLVLGCRATSGSGAIEYQKNAELPQGAAASAPPPLQVVVQPVPSKPVGPVLTPEMKAKADKATADSEALMLATVKECGAQWFGDGACAETFFRPFAEDYQAYYAFERDPARTAGRVDSLPRLGGADASVDQVTSRLSLSCEERCRSARLETIHTATEEAGHACGRAKKGYSACAELGKKIAHTLPEREADLAEGSCEGTCDNDRARAARDARRPKTKAQIAACESKCHADDNGGWCGTGVMSCLEGCQPLTDLSH